MPVGQFAKTSQEAANLALALTRLVEASNYGAETIDRPSFRVDNESLMPALDVLEQTPYLARDNDIYRIRLAAFLELDNEQARAVIADLNRILALLVEHYRNKETRSKQKKLVDIATDLQLSPERVVFCVDLLLDEAWAWAGGNSNRTDPFEKRWIQPGENVLRHKTVEAMFPTLTARMESLASERFGIRRVAKKPPKKVKHPLERGLTLTTPLIRKSLPSKKPTVLQTVFRRYEVGEQLGEGGSGVVYLVRDEDGKPYAAKVVRAGLDSDRRRRFRNELMFCSRQSHANIVKVVDWGVIGDDLPFYVMPPYESNLRRLMNAGIRPDTVLPLFTRMLDGLEAAHLQSVTHRDLKPENILCTANVADVVVADFGIARFEEEDLYTAVETQKAERLANFRYAAPEQRERGAAVDHRADIFSLGLILNELFTKQVIQGAGYRKISDVVSEFAYLDGIVERMVQQNREARPESVREVKEALFRAGVPAIYLQGRSEGSGTVVSEERFQASEMHRAAERSQNLPEYTVLIDAALRLYEVARREGALLATAAERMSGNKNGRIAPGSPSDTLDFVATQIARHIPIYGKRAPSTQFERIPFDEVRHSRFTDGATILRDIVYDQSIIWTDLAVRTADFDSRFNEMKAFATPRQELEAEAAFARGFDRNSKAARDAQLLLLTHLRDEGVRMRNEIPTFMTNAQLASWVNNLLDWMNAVIEAVKPISPVDSKWFATLDTVPPARVPIPTIRLGGTQERALYESNFRQHDYRLARLDGLLQKYGVGAKS